MTEAAKKRTSDGTAVIKKVGQLSFSRNDVMGSGSFGTVYKGKFMGTIDVAIKRILREKVTSQVETVVMTQIKSHPNVLRYFCVEEDEDFVYIATELCTKWTLKDVIEGKYLGPPLGSVREILRQMIQGVHHLHEHKIVHRDIKPTNILISFPDETTGGRPVIKLADFGLSRKMKSDGSEMSINCGTQGWMAPEMYDRNNPTNQASLLVDIFSLGLVFGVLFSIGNGHPFGPPGNLRNLRMENKESMVLTIHDLRNDAQFYDLIQQMLKPKEVDRLSAKRVLEHTFFGQVIEMENERVILSTSENYNALIAQLNQMEIIDDAFDFNKVDENGCTPLMQLCQRDQTENLYRYVKTLLNSGNNIDVNAKDKNGNNALILLCEHYSGDNLIYIIRLLLENGINVNEKTVKNGYNALTLLCVQYNNEKIIDIIRLFIQYEIDINDKTLSDDWNVLHAVCRYYNRDNLIEIVRLLIDSGCDLNVVTSSRGLNRGLNALMLICLYYRGDDLIEIVRLLIARGANVNIKTNDNWNALHIVCRYYSENNLIELVSLLISSGCDVNTIDNDNWNALLKLCRYYGHENLIEIVRLFVDNGININEMNKHNWNALHVVSRYYPRNNLIDIIKMLIDRGIDVKAKSKFGSNALILLCQNEKLGDCLLDIIYLLIENKIDMNARDNDDDNALILLCKYHESKKLRDIIRLILENSLIDVNAKNSKGMSALGWLRKRDFANSSEEIGLVIPHRGSADQEENQ